MFRFLACASAIAALVAASGASADNSLFSNPWNGSASDCSFSTTCAAAVGRGDDFAAQEFTLSQASVLTSADFIETDLGTTPTDVNWAIIMADGPGGLPGTILASGTDVLTATSLGIDVDKMSWDLGTVGLGAGTYYLAIQAISPVFDTYLGEGTLGSGAAETHDGGVTWSSGYEFFPSVAVDIFGSVPEPATWLTMLSGVGLVGAALRRRRRAVAA